MPLLIKKDYKSKTIKDHARLLTRNGHSKPVSGSDFGDHPPITPTINVPQFIKGKKQMVYEYVVKMFLANHSGDCIYNNYLLRYFND